MKTSHNLIAIIFAFSIGMFQCDTKEVDEVKPVQFDREVKFSTTIHFFRQPMALNQANAKDILETRITSTGVTSIDEMLKFEIEMIHEAFLFNGDEAVMIKKGLMKIDSNSGHEIFGEYDGFGYFSKDPMDLLLVVKIVGGTGHFAGASGYLTGISRQHQHNSHVRVLELDGIILRNTELPA